MSGTQARAEGELAVASVRARVRMMTGHSPNRGAAVQAEVVTFAGLLDGEEHLACIWHPQRSVPLVRVHSECLTGDVLGSLRCDCGPQLHEAIHTLAGEGGVLLYMRQEGRGIGLYNKLDAYLLQDSGVDTFTANKMIGRGEDEREYAAAAQMLIALGIREIHLITNNPGKVEQLRGYGIVLRSVRATEVHANPYNRAYLHAKAEIGRHRLRFSTEQGR